MISEAIALLNELILETVDFSISRDELEKCGGKASELLSSAPVAPIGRSECVAFILGMCPSVASFYEDARSSQRELEPGLYFGIMGALVSYATQLIADNRAGELAQVAKVVEFLIAEGDREVREATIAGFLEGISNVCSHDPANLPVARMTQLLGPLGKKAMRDLDRFWSSNYDEYLP